MALTKLPSVRTPISKDGVWLVPVSKTLQLGCLLRVCGDRGCDCSELMLSVYSLDETVQSFGRKRGSLVSSHLPWGSGPAELDAPLELTLDVFTAELRDAARSVLDGASDRRVAAILDALDGATLDELEQIWRRAKGFERREGLRMPLPTDWAPGELLYWDQVFEVDRPEAFRVGAQLIVALDMYCAAPNCDCKRFSVAFEEGVDDGRPEGESFGRVEVDFHGGVRFESDDPNQEPALRALWNRYVRRHPTLLMQRERYQRIQALAPELHAARRQSQAAPAALRWVPTSRKRKLRDRGR